MSLQLAYALAREATAHKRLSQSHRRIAAQRLEALRELCARMGLDFAEVRMTATEGITAHGRYENTD